MTRNAQSTSGSPKKISSSSLQGEVTDRLAEFPWWALFVLLGGVLIIYSVNTNENYNEAFNNIFIGVKLTIQITITAYFFSSILGLFTALGQLSSNVFLRNLAQLYVQIIRGVPIIVQIFYVALVLIPAGVALINNLGVRLVEANILGAENFFSNLNIRDVDLMTRGIIALAISYGAFSSEIFRAGIQSIEKGQIEASQALGMNWYQTFRYVILPQAFRRVLPPLGNDFIAMLKESSLVSAIGVNEITQLGKKYSSASFRFPETYNTLAYLYLSMTLLLSMGVKYMEKRLGSRQN